MKHQRYGISQIIKKFTSETPIYVSGLARKMGLNIVPDFSLPSDIAGKIERDKDCRYTVFLNFNDSANRIRFTLAHEIAHYVLHKDLIDDGITERGLYRSGIPDSGLPCVIERQANIFAADLLMPQKLIVNYWKDGYCKAADLAKIFNVSQKAMDIRLKELRLAR